MKAPVTDALFDRVAPLYDRAMKVVESTVLASQRPWAVSGLRGRVVEFGVGTGLNLPYYPPGTEVTGIDLSSGMLERARRRVSELGRISTTTLVQGNVEATGLESGAYDAVVSTYTLCNVDSPDAALREARRLLRPEGVLVLVEHTGSTFSPLDWLLALVDRWSGPRMGEHLRRDHPATATGAGFTLTSLERRRLGLVVRVRATPDQSAQSLEEEVSPLARDEFHSGGASEGQGDEAEGVTP